MLVYDTSDSGVGSREEDAQDVRLCPMFKSSRPVTLDMKVVLPDPVILREAVNVHPWNRRSEAKVSDMYGWGPHTP